MVGDVLAIVGLGAAAGLVGGVVAAAFSMVLPDGDRSASVLVGRLRGDDPDSIDRSVAGLALVVGGTIGGILFGVLVLGIDAAGAPVDPVSGGAGAVLLIAYVGVSWILLPSSSIEDTRRARTAWAGVTAIYAVVLALVGNAVL